MKSIKSFIYTSLLIFAILILVNILSNKLWFRLDFTEDKQYTLSNATKDVIDELAEPVTVTAYFSENLAPELLKTRNDFKSLLIEYANRSKGQVVYEFISPNEDEAKEQEAMQAGIQPVLINQRDKDEVKQQKAYLGALIQVGEQKEPIPFLQPGAAMEYALTTAIKKLIVVDKPLIGVLQGHGEPAMNSLSQTLASLNILYNIEPVTLSGNPSDLDRFSTLAIIAPTDSLNSLEFQQIDAFLAEGKNIFVAINRVDGDLQKGMGNIVNTGLESWLSKKGIQVNPNFVLDVNCGNVQVMQQGFPFPMNMQFPYLPIINNFDENHPIVQGLEQVIFQFASTITYLGDTSNSFEAIVKTSEKSSTQPAPLYFDISRQWQESDFPQSNLTVGVTLSGKLAGSIPSKMVVIGDGGFAVGASNPSQQQGQINPDNVSLLVNSIDWLSDDTGLIDLRTKGISSRPIDEIEDSRRTFLKYFNFLLPIILILIVGFIRNYRNKIKRLKRMEEGYVF